MRYGTIVLIAWFFPISAWGIIASNATNLSQQGTDGQSFVISLGISPEVESGDMTYTIQGLESDGWKSELAWPLEDIVYLGGIVSVRFVERFQVSTGFWKNVNGAEGTMKDSDWFYAWYGDEKAIYSETDSPVEAAHVDFNIRYDVFKPTGIAVGPMIGYAYTKWNWEAGNGYQTSIDPDNYYVGVLPEKSITYEETIKVPYVGLAVSFYPTNSPLGFNGYLLYSSLAKCKDVDDHVLRYKKATGDTDGTFFSIGGDISWNFTGPWSVTGKLNYTSYDLKGKQDQVFYAGDAAGTRFDDIDLAIEGSQFSLGLMVSYNLL